MSHFKYVLSSGSWCQLKRLQSSATQIQIPPRIERGPTDILTALESTIPEKGREIDYVYRNDPYLFPMKKHHYRLFALAYDSGKRAAMWIHKKHTNLFPKHLSEPPIQAFERPLSYKKSNASEELLLKAISEGNKSDAIYIYELLETNVSNTTKQALLEFLCFYANRKALSKEFLYEKWYTKPMKSYWQNNDLINQLYEFLTKQDHETAALAHSAMMCGLALHQRGDECWILFKQCEKENIPLTLTSYNSILAVLAYNTSKKEPSIVNRLYNILNLMNEKGIKPNIKTLNNALDILIRLSPKSAEAHMRNMCETFRKLNIKYSLGTYYRMINILVLKGSESQHDFKELLHAVSKEKFVIQDQVDIKFFPHAMYFASFRYFDRKLGDMIHNLLLTDDNYKFITDNVIENTYYSAYMSLILSTSTITEFFEFYEKLVPNKFIPTINIYMKIIKQLTFHRVECIATYLVRIWSDVSTYGYGDISLKLGMISLMDINDLPADSPLRSFFVDAAWDCWNSIKLEIQNKPTTYNPVETTMTSFIAMILLCGGRIDESIEILKYTIEKTHLFTPTMKEDLLDKLFETCMLKQCIEGALLVLEYGINFGFSQVTEMAKELYNLPQLRSIERDKLISLIGEEELTTSNV